MVQYLYAKNTNGSLVDISNVTDENREKYYCPSCGIEMSAVLGNKREHHFRHKGDTCSYESYLHKISKLLLKWRFDNDDEFTIAYCVSSHCPKTECPLRDSNCNTNPTLKRINLKEKYNLCEIEGSYNGFRADIKLSNSDKPEATPMFLEVAVTHPCSPEKISSGVPIVEISVTNERDVLGQLIERPTTESPLHPQRISFTPQPIEERITFHNFDRIIPPSKQLSRFIIYKDNSNCIRRGIEKHIGLCDTIIGQPNKNSLFEIQFDEAALTKTDKHLINLFGIYLANKEGIDIKDCRICQKYRGCTIQIPTDLIDEKTKKRIVVKVPIMRLNNEQFNPTHQANQCEKFNCNRGNREVILKHFKNFKYCVSKPYLSDAQS